MTHPENSAPTETARHLPPLRTSGSFESVLLFLPHACGVVEPWSLCSRLISLRIVLRKDSRDERQTKIGFKSNAPNLEVVFREPVYVWFSNFFPHLPFLNGLDLGYTFNNR